MAQVGLCVVAATVETPEICCQDVIEAVFCTGESQGHAKLIAREEGLVFINGFDHPQVIAGLGTMALEIVEQVPDIDVIIVPAGPVLILSMAYPSTHLYRVCPSDCPLLEEISKI